MSTSSEDAIGLKKALEYDDLQKQYLDLQKSYNDVLEKNSSLVSECTKTKAELDTHKTLKAATELEIKGIEDKLQDLVKNETILRSINVQTLKKLNEKRDKLQKVEDELSQLRQNLTSKTISIEDIKAELLTLTDAKHTLIRDLSIARKEKDRVAESLQVVQRTYSNYRSNNVAELKRLESNMTRLETENEECVSTLKDLESQRDRNEREMHDMRSKFERTVEEKNRIELSLSCTSKSYKELSVLHEKYVVQIQEKVSTIEAKIASIAGERDALKLTNTQLEASLKQERELRKEHFEKITGAVTSSSDTQSASRLLNLMRDYEKLNRHPADVYEDFFRLQADYQKVIIKSSQDTKTVEEMTRKLNENENIIKRCQRELQESRAKVVSYSTALKKKADDCKKLEEDNKKLKNEMNDVDEERLGLKASLTDTTYQLQYLLSDVQRRNEPIPANLRESASLLGSAQVTPTVPHVQLVYKNVAELQDLNTKLTYEVRALTQKVQLQTSELDLANSQNSNNNEAYSAALEEAKQTVTDLSKKSTDLQNQLDTMTVECNNYKNIISQLGDGDANDRFEEMKQTQLHQRKEGDIAFQKFTEETSSEIAKLSEDIQTARAATVESKNECSRLNAELNQAIRNQATLKEKIKELQLEKTNTKQQTIVLGEYVAQKDVDLQTTQDKLRDSKHKINALENEMVYLQSRIESTTTAYNAMKDTVNSESSSKVHMTHLLEAINSRMELFTDSSSKDAEKFKETIEKLNRELQHARDTLATTEKELDNYKSIDQQEIKEKYNESVIEIRLLKTKIADIEQQLSNVNQDRIIAQTKLAAAEEQIKNLSTSETSNGSTDDSNSCTEHIRMLASAEDRIRVLEYDVENYHTVIAQNEKAVEKLTKEHDDYVANSQVNINNLVKELEAKTAAVAVVQAEADQNIAQFKTLHEKALSTQSDLIKEKQVLEAKVEDLVSEKLDKENEIKSLREVVEEKNVACVVAETKLATQAKTTEECRQTVSTLRADVSNLTNEIADYKAKVEASNATLEMAKKEYSREAIRWAEFEESLKNTLVESEKQRENIAARLDDFIQKYGEWKAGIENNVVDKQAFAGSDNFILEELREVNKNFSVDREITFQLYRSEKEERQRVLAELDPLKQRLIFVQMDLKRAQDEIQRLSTQGPGQNDDFKLQCDAFKIQNKALYEENERLKLKQEELYAELEKKNEQLTPMLIQLQTLKQQFDTATNEVKILNNAQKEWAGRSADLLSKYNIKDPAEMDRMVAESEAAKSELEALKAEKTELEKRLEQMKTEKESSDSERNQLALKVRDRGRIAIEFRKKAADAEAKAAECEKKLNIAEAARVAASSQSASKIVKGKEELDEEKKKIEDALKAKTDECLALEKKYNSILIRARSLQQDRAKNLEELKSLRVIQAEAVEMKAQIVSLEEELNVARKTLQANSVELTRLKAQNSMALNKSTRMQKELDNLKATKLSTLSAAAPAFQVPSPVVESPSATQVNSPVIPEVVESHKITTPEVNGSPKIITPVVNSSPKIITPEVNSSPKIITPEVNSSPKIITPEVNSSPKIITPEVNSSPMITTPEVNTSPKTTTPEVISSPKIITPEVNSAPKVVASEDNNPPEVAAVSTPSIQVRLEAPTPETAEAEESTVATPNIEADVEIDELVTASPAVDLDSDLIDEETTNAEVNEDIAGSNEDVAIKEETLDESADSTQVDEELLEEVELTVETGVKRERVDDDDDATSPESPTKKAHIDE